MNLRHAATVWGQLLLAAMSLVAEPVLAQRVFVFSSSDGVQYKQALAGIQKHGLPVESFQVTGDNDAALASVLARTGRDSVIVTLGGRASTLVANAATGTTTVNCMVLGDDNGKAPVNTQVVPLEVPIEVQMQWLKRLLPKVRLVGLLYDPAQNERRATETVAALTRVGFQTVLEPVPTPNALPAALNRLNNNVDVLFALPDTTVFAREYSRSLLLFSFRNFIPLAGPNEGWVRAGALYAVEWDYADLGRHCVALGLRQLAGNRTPPPSPAMTRAIVNLRSAEQLRINWDAEILRTVERVVE